MEPSSFSHLCRRWLVPVLMSGVALQQMALVSSSDLSPWKGGGFGMFASIDTPSTRIFRVQAKRDTGVPITLSLDSSDAVFERQLIRATTIPSEENIRTVAQYLINASWVPSGAHESRLLEQLQSPRLPPSHPEAVPQHYRMRNPLDSAIGDQAIRFDYLRALVWRPRYDFESGRVWTEPVGALVEVQRTKGSDP